MTFRGDERAQALQVGAVILLGFLVVGLAIYQVTVVPDQNRQVEIQHSEAVQGQLQAVGDLVTSVAGGGGGGSRTVTLGTTYPVRTVFVNPPPATGRLETEELGEITIAYDGAPGNEPGVEQFWNGTERSYDTSAVVYRPDYNEYDDAPETRYEHSLVYNRFAGANLTLSDQILVRDGELTIVAVEGEYAASRVDGASLRVRALSASENTVTLSGDAGDPIEVTIPTESPERWADQLEGYDVDPDPAAGTITVTLAEDQDLTMARVGVGESTRGTPDERSAYVAVTEERAPAVTVEVRDRYNNPVRGATVEVTRDDGTTETLVSDRRGEIEVADVEAGDTLSFGDGGIDYPLEDFEVKPGASDGGGSQPAYAVNWEDADTIAAENPNVENEDGLVFRGGQGETADLGMFTDPVADGADVSYAVNDTAVGEVDATGETDAAGENATTFTAKENGTVTVFTSSGSDGDRLTMDVEVEEADVTFTTLEASLVTQSVGPNDRPSEVIIDQFEISSDVDVTFTATESNEDQTATQTVSGPTGSDVSLEIDNAANNRFPVTVTAEIDGGQCLETTFQEGEDQKTLASGEWEACGS
ncbi:MAG: hypothetical protein V5A46_06265 [Haloferacaceae archaeon]